MADGELFTTFVDSSPALSLPIVSTDMVPIVRSSVAYRVAPTQLSAFGLGTVTYISPITGATITAVSGQGAFVIVPAAGLTTLAVVLPPVTVDGTIFEASTTENIDAVTVAAAAGTSIYGTQGTLGLLGAGGGFSFRYRLSNTTWYRRY